MSDDEHDNILQLADLLDLLAPMDITPADDSPVESEKETPRGDMTPVSCDYVEKFAELNAQIMDLQYQQKLYEHAAHDQARLVMLKTSHDKMLDLVILMGETLVTMHNCFVDKL